MKPDGLVEEVEHCTPSARRVSWVVAHARHGCLGVGSPSGGRPVAVCRLGPGGVFGSAVADRPADRTSEGRGVPRCRTSLVVPAVLALDQSDPGIEPVVHELAEDQAVALLHSGHLDVLLVEDEADQLRPTPVGLRARRLLDDPYRLALPVTWPGPPP